MPKKLIIDSSTVFKILNCVIRAKVPYSIILLKIVAESRGGYDHGIQSDTYSNKSYK